jgi:cation-transporting ATPase E
VKALGAEAFLAAFAGIIKINQTALSAFLVAVGLLLLPFVEPPTGWWVGADRLSGDWRPTWLAVGLGGVFVVIVLTPMGEFFDFAPLTPLHAAFIGGALVLWLLLVRLTWRRRLLERFFGIEASNSAQ